MSVIAGVLELLVMLLLVRLMVRPAEAFFHPMYRLLYKITDPILLPSRYLTKTQAQGVLVTVLALTVLKGALYSASGQMGLARGVGESSLELLHLLFQAYMVLWIVAVLGSQAYGNPLGQMVARAFLPLDSLLGYVGFPRRRILMGSLLLLWVLFVLFAALLRGFFMLKDFPPPELFLAGFFEGLLLFIGLFPFPGFFSLVLVAGALLSWVNPDPRNPIVNAIYGISEPLLAPFRRFIPNLGGIDLSPLVALLAFQILGSAAQQLVLQVFRSIS
jgi:YggT family protein